MKRLTLFFISSFLATFFAAHIGAQTSSSDAYKIGINDVLQITVLDNNELNTIATVTSDGTITFPYIGTVAIKGLSLSEIDKTITQKLSEGYIKYPVITVSLMQSMSRKIYVYGEFNKRGEMKYEDGMTVVHAMSMAGGLSKGGLYGEIVVRRKRGDSNIYIDLIKADINNGFLNDRKIEDIFLKPDDILIVKRNKTFLIQGEVAQRGRMVLEKNMTVLRALLQAGGVIDSGLYGTIKLRRKQEGAAGKYKDVVEATLNNGGINDSEIEDMVLQSDDILIVKRNKTFLIQGEVAQRGRMVLEKNMTMLSALLQAGGVSKDGLHGRIILRRKDKEQTGEYKDIAAAKLIDGVIESSEVESTLIQPDDILRVERNKSFFIYGEVNMLGEFVLKHNMTVFKALTIAKGFTKWGSLDHVEILRQSEDGSAFITIKVDIGDVIKGKAIKDILIRAEDIIVVSSGVF